MRAHLTTSWHYVFTVQRGCYEEARIEYLEARDIPVPAPQEVLTYSRILDLIYAMRDMEIDYETKRGPYSALYTQAADACWVLCVVLSNDNTRSADVRSFCTHLARELGIEQTDWFLRARAQWTEVDALPFIDTAFTAASELGLQALDIKKVYEAWLQGGSDAH